jgi:hypothetical protein
MQKMQEQLSVYLLHPCSRSCLRGEIFYFCFTPNTFTVSMATSADFRATESAVNQILCVAVTPAADFWGQPPIGIGSG